jgi:hypothetical protein
MKPSWNSAPEWASYLAQDEDGDWYWFELEPQPGRIQWNLNESRGKYEPCKKGWEGTLERRP